MAMKKTKIIIEGNKPILLNDPDAVWQVQSGRVDVFSVRLKDGNPSGKLHHMFRAEIGSTMFGMEQIREFGLLFQGAPGTELVKQSKRELQELSENELYRVPVVFLLEQWVIDVSEALIRELHPVNFRFLTAGEKDESSSEEVLGTSEDILWISSDAPGLQFLGNGRILDESKYWPLTKKSWFTCGKEMTFETIDTDTLFEHGLAWESLENFQKLIIQLVAEYRMEYEKDEKEHFEIKALQEEKSMEDALRHLAGVVSEKHDETLEAFDDSDKLLKACRIIGDRLGVKFLEGKSEEGDNHHTRLDSVCRASRVRSRKVALKGEWWKKDNGPLLAFMGDAGRPVALIPAGGKAYSLHEPEKTRAVMVDGEIASELSGFAYSFYKPFSDRKIGLKEMIAYGLESVSNFDKVMVSLMGVLGGVLNLAIPVATGFLFSSIIPAADRSQLLWMTIFLVSGAFASLSFQLLRSIAWVRLAGKMDACVQAALWDRLMSLSVSFFRKYSAGDLASRALGISKIRQILSGVVMNTFFTAVFSLFNLVLLFFYDAFLGSIALSLVSLMCIVIGILGSHLLNYQRRVEDKEGKIAGLVLQLINGIGKFKVAGAEKRVFSMWAKVFSEQRRVAFKARRVSNLIATMNAAFPVIITSLLFLLVIKSQRVSISPGNFLAFNVAYASFLNAMIALTSIFTMAINVVPLFERARVILEEIPEVDDQKNKPGELSGSIEISHLNFRYKEDGPLVLDDVSLQVKSGEYVAFVGPSGSGKSTLLRLLVGFEKPESGAIHYDRQDLEALDVQAVRRQMGVVLQNDQLMSGDIFTNIIGSHNLNLDDAWKAAELSGLAEDIRQMPMGMNTFVTEGGESFSGGQRQRLLIARAVVRKPRILFFDEATSALDNRTQSVVAQSLDRLESTRVVIAHRLSTIMKADCIYVMDQGRIVQKGTYGELINQDGLFSKLAKRQIA